ncbi:Transcription initiation factor IIB [Mortierella sp. GBA43]|nr:Transcription initiation factor IIB [Mortierella sp. GBA43]
MPPHDPQFRHSGPVGPSQHGPPQQGGYPPDGSYHPPPPPGHPAPGFNGELYRGPDGYLPEDQQRGKVPYPPSGAPQNWPGATSPRGAWDTAAAREEVNHRRTESLQDYPMRAMVDAKGAPRAEAEMAAYGSASRTLTPTLTMGRPGPGMGMPSGPGAQGMEMAGLPDLSSPPMSAGVKETPPGSTSPEGLPTTSQTKKRGRKAKNHGLSGSPGPQTSNVMMVDPSEPMTPKRGKARKRVDGDRESIGGGDRQWTVVTNLNYATPPHPHPDREKAQGMAEPPRHDVRMEGGPYMARGDMDRPVGDQGHQDIRYPDGGAAPLPKPGYEHQRHLSGQFMHPSAPYPHGHGPTEEMEYQQRLQQQQQQPSQPPPPSPSQQQHPIHEHPQQQQQQQQAPSQFQHSPPVHPPHPHGGQYNNAHFPRQHGPESMDGPSEYGAPRAGPGKAPAAPPRVAAAPGKEPEGLDTIAANTLVIFHQKGIQPNDPEDKRPRLESPHRRQESFSGHPQQHHMVAGEGGDMRGRGAPRNNLAQEAEALLILGRPHPQGDQKSQQQQQQQQQRHPHQPPPPQHEALPHPSYARAHGNPYPEQGQYDPPHGAMSRDAPHAGHMVQPHNGPYDPHAAHGRGVEDPDRFRRPGGFPTDAEDRNGFSRPPGAPFENGPPKQPYSQQFPSSAPMPLHFPPGQAHQRDQWPDAPLPGQEYAHGYQNGMSQDTPMHPVGTGMELGESGVVPPSGAPAAKPKATKPKPKPKAGVRIVSDHDRMEGPPEPLSSTSDRSHDSQQQFSPVQDQSGDSLAMALSTDRPPTTKTNRGKGRPKAVPPPQLRASSESLLHREAGGAVGGNFGHRSQETSPITERPRPFKSDEGMNDRGPLYNVNAGGHNISAFGSMILGSGMILVPPSEGSGQFPPTQLSIRTNRDHHHHHHHLGGGASSAAASGPSSAAVAAAGANESPSTLTSPSTPLPTNSVKKRRSRPLLEQDDRNLDGADTVPDSPKQPPSAKNRHAPRSPPPPTSLSRGKSNNRPRKGAVSTDADIERSNEITRTTGLPGGPSWLTSASNHATTSGGNNSSSGSNNNNNTGNGSNANASNANGLNRSTILMTGPIKTGGGDACNGTPGSSAAATAAAAAAARRPPMPPSNLSTETTNQRKRKRIKIEDKDERQGQRSSTISDMGGELEAGGMEMGSGSSSGSLVNKTGTANNSSKQRTGAAAEDGHDRDHDEDEAMEGEDEDETLEEGDRESGDVIGARKRRSPGDDDDDQGDDETGGAAGGSNGTNAHGGSNGQTRGSGGMGGRKHMKRKSNSDLSNGGTTKKLRDTTKVHSPDATKSTMSMSDHHVNGGTSKFGTNGSIKVEDGAAAAAAESDTEIEYLPMEDDPECPHMFGIDESDREKDSSSEDEAEEEEEDLVKTEGETGRVTAAPSSKKSNGGGGGGGQKGKESTEVQDDIQEKGRAWVSRLAMPESAWDESFQTYERVKRLKELKNRQPVRKRDAILAAILYIVCRNLSSPRTFSEICSASGVKRGDVGNYYRLMLKILEPSKSASATARDTDAEAFMTRWCDSLSLSPFLRKTAVQVFSSANHMNLTSGKCPSSVGAASIYLCIFAWNDARRAANCRRYKCSGCQCQGAAEHPLLVNDGLWIRKEPKDVAIAVGVVSATLMGCFRSLAPEMDKLLPPEFLTAAVEGL